MLNNQSYQYPRSVMHTQYSSQSRAVTAPRMAPIATGILKVERLANEHQAEVLELLARRPIHTIAMTGFIHDNGLVSPLNRGTFYGCRNQRGELEGVALVGHATLMETLTDRALEAFAQVAQECKNTHMIMGELDRVEEFWSYYSNAGQGMRLACRESLFELQWPIEVQRKVDGLRRATLEDLELVMPVQAQMAFDESGLNPMELDSVGFRQRCIRRIQKGRTWVYVENGALIFKAEVISDTPEVAYLEGVWVNETKRGKGIGSSCFSQVGRELLQRSKSICLLLNEKNEDAQAFYRKAGYECLSTYDTIFLESQIPCFGMPELVS